MGRPPTAAMSSIRKVREPLACHLDLVFNRLQVTLDPNDHLPL